MYLFDVFYFFQVSYFDSSFVWSHTHSDEVVRVCLYAATREGAKETDGWVSPRDQSGMIRWCEAKVKVKVFYQTWFKLQWNPPPVSASAE